MPPCPRCGTERPEEAGPCPACGAVSSDSPTVTVVRGEPTPTGPVLTRPAPFLHFAPGQPFGDRYTIVEEVGTGGMGQVYKVLDRSLGRPVALKLIRPEAAAHAGNIERFRRELALAREVTHSNVCRVHDLGEQDGINYLTMEYVEGQTLEDLIQSVGHLSPRQTVVLGRQVCAGLLAIHERSIIHRDLKPGNIMVDRAGHARVMDFGMAYHEHQERLTGAGGVMGTLAYLSPEQARGKAMDARSDLYAFGLILYEMLTGRRPPADGGHLPLALRDPGERCPPPSAFSPEVPPALDAIVMRCLERDPDRRFGSAEELGGALAHLEAGLSTASLSASRGLPWTGPVGPGRPRWLWLAAAAVLLPVLGLAAYQAWRRPPPAQGERPVLAVLPITNGGGDPADNDLAVGITELLVDGLAATAEMSVVPRTEIARRTGPAAELPKLVRDFGLTHVVTGSVQRAEDTRLRAAATLLRADGSIVSAFEYEDKDTLALVRRLTDALRASLNLTAARGGSPQPPATRDVAAFVEYSRGLALLDRSDVKGNIEAAIGHFEGAIRRDSSFALAHAGLGEAYLAQHRATTDTVFTTKAVSEIMTALNLDPDHPRVRVALAKAQSRTGKRDLAIAELRQAIALHPRDDDAHRLLGDYLVEDTKYDEALAEIRKAIEIRPSYPVYHISLGYALYRAGRIPEAIDAYTRASQLQPDNALVHQMIGAAYIHNGEPAKAQAAFRQSIDVAPSARAYSGLGSLLFDQGDFAGSAAAFEQAVELEPKRALAYRNLGDVYERLGETEKARRVWGEAVRLGNEDLQVNPRDASTQAMVAVCEMKLGRSREAETHAAQAVEASPKDGEVLYRVAAVYAIAGRPREALPVLERAIEAGYSPALAKKDYDLRTLRPLPEFQDLVNRPRRGPS